MDRKKGDLSRKQLDAFKFNFNNVQPKLLMTYLQSLLGQIPLTLDLDVEAGGDVRHQDVDELAHSKHHVLEDDNKGELDSQDLPVNRSEEALVIPEPPVETFRLEILDRVKTFRNIIFQMGKELLLSFPQISSIYWNECNQSF